MMIDKVSLIQPLPRRYRERDQHDRRASATVTHANWFGGIYQDPKNFFANMAVDPESWLRDVSRVRAAGGAEEGLAGRPDRAPSSACDTARRFGWKVGDRVPLQGVIYRKPDGEPVGVHHRRHLRLDREGRRQVAVLLPLRLPERDDPGPATATIRSAGT